MHFHVLLQLTFSMNLNQLRWPVVVFNLHYASWHWQKGEGSGLCLHRGNGIKSREKSTSLRSHASWDIGKMDTSWHAIRAHCTLGALQLVSVIFKFFFFSHSVVTLPVWASSISVQAITRSDRRDTLRRCRNLSAVCGNYWCPWYLMWNGDGNL